VSDTAQTWHFGACVRKCSITDGEEGQLGDIGDGERDRPCARGWIEEVVADEIVLQAIEIRPDGADDGVRARRRGNAARPAHEQGIVEGIAEPAEGTADGRLADTQPSCRTTDAQLVVQGDGNREQIQIELLDGHNGLNYRPVVYCAWNAEMSGCPVVMTLLRVPPGSSMNWSVIFSVASPQSCLVLKRIHPAGKRGRDATGP
jgi:hypothetical protein